MTDYKVQVAILAEKLRLRKIEEEKALILKQKEIEI